MVLLIIGGNADIAMTYIRMKHERYSHIIAHYRVMNDEFEALCKEFGKKIIPVQADLSNEEDIPHLLEQIDQTKLIPDDILFMAAQPCENGHFHKIPAETFRTDMQIGFFSLCQILQAYIGKMAKRKYGRVVVMLSDVIETTPAYCSHYVSTKYAMLGLLKALASEYGPKGIYVTGISPGWTDTRYIKNQPKILVETYIQKSPLKRLIKKEEVAARIADAFEIENDKYNGQNIII